ncbi:MAG: 1-(5-phosphoribosyl)-5-[(5-phosphoribosylamino)methylideneamino]imidazole-4-carboxamide isomerase [Erysipelotrichaceae bacterium]|uniref:1-(5-phosphoribosyl)-5-[(5- phosphoribosylamino)methylideneamino]imidazole-4- carboxamide isomerase n=1 Tax=Floccifex sp. TaxID=2815810 RepID=UPI002A74EBAA|nr:1-(5-phosphoribosyl)-5-[(5-phosphoribosylamino)methylideneamino]imidazole-4-carboxamide isomerase [Floccifex sp.]MDD7281548.1 1-(5-phosphoribosyl)-5-[(5-phosphoribosylamino)methylideneamino]imidazole-4-carboxamide isomerase [Erysipelotrichaceae bacterium]MDY2957509.1 1-(5-phosphoribosyl)-5-[(5-phosphoribosylamino)methylideneamino]imidazole-4-carboxamide isomerase [Floccifex sp.]
MIIIPAIDIIEQKPVRLYQGDYNKKEVVGSDVLSIAMSFQNQGAQYVHCVDLDGAKSGKKENAKLICEVAQSLSIPVEVGGGIRTMEDISFYLDNGVSCVILGTAAIQDEELLKQALAKYGTKIAVGIDCKDGIVVVNGWLESSEMYYVDFAKKMDELGVQTIIFTDISKDGTLMGPNFEMLKTLKSNVKCDIVASGGIKDMTHIKSLNELGLYGAITGKAMYTNSLNLEEAILYCQEN